VELDECVSCGAGLISVSNICPQCGCPRNKRIKLDESEEKIVNDTELDEVEEKISNDTELDEVEEKISNDTELDELQEELDALKKQNKDHLTKIKNKISRPAGVRLISIFYMLFGISLILFALIAGSAVLLLVNSSVMSTLGGIGGDMGNMPMLPGMSSIDPSTMSFLVTFVELNKITGAPGAGEIAERLNYDDILDVDVIIGIIGETIAIVLIECIVGIFSVVVGRGLFGGKKLARPAIIVSSIISIPLVVSFVTVDSLVLLGMAVFNGMILYYMFKSKTREYFNQTSIKKFSKKSKIKTSRTVKKSKK